MPTVRIAIVGDESTGKSSLITSLVKDTFVSSKITAVLPHITIPPSLVDGGSENVTTVIVDTSALPQDRPVLAKEVRKSNVILLVYSDHYSFERVALFWLPYFRSLGVSLPIVLCANKSDLVQNGEKVVEEEMLPVMSEWKEIDSCIRTSAREHYNVNEAFFLCQKAVTHPVAPLFDAKEGQLKPACAKALNRIFYLCDKDRDGLLNDAELQAFQQKCFDKDLHEDDLAYIKDTVETMLPDEDMKDGINPAGFLLLNRLYAEKGRHETIWIILRTFQYTDSLSLMETFLHPKFDVPEFCSAELSPAGYQFFIDLFLTSSHDNNGGLTDHELARIFAPTPGIPPSWTDEGFPNCTVRNEAGHITLQGWLAQWSMTTFTSPKTTLEYLAYLGFESPDKSNRSTTAALKVTKPRKRRRKAGRVQRNVVFAQVLGSPHAGKSSILDTFLGRMSLETYNPTIHPRIAVNTVELSGGKQIYLILQELGESSSATLDNEQKLLQQTDLLVYVYDSSDPDSFKHIPALHTAHPHVKELPSLYVALKADLDRTTQRSEVQPDEYVANLLRMPQGPPIHTSVKWPTIQELYVSIAEACLEPTNALPKPLEDEDSGKVLRYGLAFGALVCAVGGAVWVWKRAWGDST